MPGVGERALWGGGRDAEGAFDGALCVWMVFEGVLGSLEGVLEGLGSVLEGTQAPSGRGNAGSRPFPRVGFELRAPEHLSPDESAGYPRRLMREQAKKDAERQEQERSRSAKS